MEHPAHTVLRTGSSLHWVRPAHALGAVGLIIAYPLASAGARTVLYALACFGVVVAIVAGVLIHRPRPAPWLVLAAAFVAYLTGSLLVGLRQAVTGTNPPYPWYSDYAYLTFYPLACLSLCLFLRRRGRPDRSGWLDAGIWAVGAALLIWKPLIEPYVGVPGATLTAGLVGVGYPLLDLALGMLVVRLLTDTGTRRTAGVLLAAGVAAQVGTDLAYGIRSLEAFYYGGGILDMGWMVAYALVGAAALHPKMAELTSRSDEPAEISSRGRLTGLLAPVLLAPGLFVVELVAEGPTRKDTLLVAVAFPLLFFLAASRAGGVLSVAERRASALAVHQEDLEESLVERRAFTQALQEALRDNERSTFELRYRADHDTLTGLASRDRFTEALGESLVEALARGGRPSIAVLDLDDFRTVNDTLGHQAGDMMLLEVARRVRVAAGPERLVARLGGDEFAVLMSDGVELVAERVLATLRAPFLVAAQELRLELSIGVATAHDLGCSPGDVLREADVAMYAAKAAGGGWLRYRSSMSAAATHRLTLRARLVQALVDGEIEPWFQPVVDLSSGRLVGFEALARWCRPNEPPLPPDDWLPWAEQSGLVVQVDQTVLAASVAQLATWRRTHDLADLDLAVNMSGRSLQKPGIEREILQVLRLHCVPADRLVLEVTEGVLIEDDRIAPRLQRLRAAGVRIALDDFGTGWSSLSNLCRLPVDQLKLDRSFTTELGRAGTATAVPAAVIQLARSLSLSVVAEGVETLEQRRHLIDLGFDSAQGYLFGRALPPDELADTVSCGVVGVCPEFVEPVAQTYVA